MTTRCTRCSAAVYGTVTPALDERYGIGWCHACGRPIPPDETDSWEDWADLAMPNMAAGHEHWDES